MFAQKIQISTVDYPAHLSQVIYTVGCNLNCHFCHNHPLIDGDGVDMWSPEEMLSRLIPRKKFTSYVVITGGEPTIQTGLFDFCRKLRDAGFIVKLDTNGFKSSVVDDLIQQNCLAYVAMDLKTSFQKYTIKQISGNISYTAIIPTVDIWSKLIGCMTVLHNSGIEHEYRTTPLRNTCDLDDFLSLRKILESIYRGQYKPTWYIQETKPVAGKSLQLYTRHELDDICVILQNNTELIIKLR